MLCHVSEHGWWCQAEENPQVISPHLRCQLTGTRLSHGAASLAARLPSASQKGSAELRDTVQAVCWYQPQDEGICRLSPGQMK